MHQDRKPDRHTRDRRALIRAVDASTQFTGVAARGAMRQRAAREALLAGGPALRLVIAARSGAALPKIPTMHGAVLTPWGLL